MLNIKTLSVLAIAGTAAAAPQGWGSWGANYFSGNRNNGNGGNKQPAVTNVDVVTAYTTVTHKGNWNWGGNNNNNNNNKPSATATATYVAQTPSPTADKPAASSPASNSGSGSSNSGYMGTVDTWRSKMGMSALSHDSTLEANALKTAVDGNGQMVHELNPGSFAQVLAPGSADEFEKVFVGGWLCEVPSLPGLDGVCATMSQGWAYNGQTGHADILSSSKYSKIGCALAKGIWACDLS